MLRVRRNNPQLVTIQYLSHHEVVASSPKPTRSAAPRATCARRPVPAARCALRAPSCHLDHDRGPGMVRQWVVRTIYKHHGFISTDVHHILLLFIYIYNYIFTFYIIYIIFIYIPYTSKGLHTEVLSPKASIQRSFRQRPSEMFINDIYI